MLKTWRCRSAFPDHQISLFQKFISRWAFSILFHLIPNNYNKLCTQCVFLSLLLLKYILMMPRTCSKGSPPLNNRHSFALTTSIFQKMMRIVLIVLLMRNINDCPNLLLTPRRTLVTGNISRVSWEGNRCEENKEVKAPGHFFFLRERSWENMVMNSSEIFLYSIQR